MSDFRLFPRRRNQIRLTTLVFVHPRALCRMEYVPFHVPKFADWFVFTEWSWDVLLYSERGNLHRDHDFS